MDGPEKVQKQCKHEGTQEDCPTSEMHIQQMEDGPLAFFHLYLASAGMCFTSYVMCDGVHCFSIADVELLELTSLLQQLVPQWRTLALNLGIPLWWTDMIDDKRSAKDCFFKVLEEWFTNSNKDEEPTLEVLYHALESHAVGNRALALKILEDVEVLELLTVSDKAEGFIYAHPYVLCIVIITFAK